MAAQPPTRRDPPTPDDAAAGLGAATLAQLVAAGAAVGPAAVGAVGKGAAVGAASLPHRTARAAAEAVERALDGFWMQQLAIARRKARARLGEALPHWTPSMLDRAVAEELRYEEEFKRKSRARWARDLPAALGNPDPEARRKALTALLDRERRYAEQRYAAIVRRVEARVERERVREASPLGAYWTMDPRLKTHTPGCVALAGHFWPWAVIDRVHPPVHASCGCRLWGLDDALARGWMRADQVPDPADALLRARLLARRIEELHGELSEAELREALVAGVDGRHYDLRYPRGTTKGGEYRPRRGGDPGRRLRKDLRRLIEPPPHAALREQREPVRVNGRTVMVPWDKLWRGRVGEKRFYSPPQSTNVYEAHEPVPRAAGPGLIEKLRERASEVAGGARAEQLDDMRARLAAGQGPIMPGEGIGRLGLLPLLGYRRTATSQTSAEGRPAVEDRWRDGEGNIVTVTRGNAPDGYTDVVGSRVERARTPTARLLDRPPRDFDEFKADTVAWAQRMAAEHSRALGLTDVREDGSLSDSSAYRDWDGVVRFGPDVRRAVEVAARQRDGGTLADSQALDMLIAQQVAMHEASHAIDTEYEYRFQAPGRRNLEEALTEEVGLLEGARRLRDTGQGDVLQWAADHPDHWQLKGNYRDERVALATALDHAGVAPEDRNAYVYDLKYEADPEQRLPRLARDAANHNGTDYDEELARVTSLMDDPMNSPLSAPWTALPALPPEAAELRREGPTVAIGDGPPLRAGATVSYRKPVEGFEAMATGTDGRVVSLDRNDDGTWDAQLDAGGDTAFVHGIREGEGLPGLTVVPGETVNGIPEGARVAWTRPDGKETEGTLDRVLLAQPFGGWAFEAVTADGKRAVVTNTSTRGLRRLDREASPGRAMADTGPDHNDLGWYAGSWGKGWLFGNGRVVTWATPQMGGEPEHEAKLYEMDAAGKLPDDFDPGDWTHAVPVVIDPEGGVALGYMGGDVGGTPSPDQMRQLRAADGSLRRPAASSPISWPDYERSPGRHKGEGPATRKGDYRPMTIEQASAEFPPLPPELAAAVDAYGVRGRYSLFGADPGNQPSARINSLLRHRVPPDAFSKLGPTTLKGDALRQAVFSMAGGERPPDWLTSYDPAEVLRGMDLATRGQGAPRDLVTWRGVDDATYRRLRGLRPGDAGVVDLGFQSTSLVREDAEGEYAVNGGLLEIRVPEGTPAVWKGEPDSLDEAELVLGRGLRMRVVSHEPDRTVLEVVPDREASPGRIDLRDWTPGGWGKGFVVDGELRTWAVDRPGLGPQHDQAAEAMGVEDFGPQITITPDGFATETGGYLNAGILQEWFPGTAGATFGTDRPGDYYDPDALDASVPGAPVDEADGMRPAWEVELERRREAMSSLVRGHGLKWEPDYERWWSRRAAPALDERSPGRASEVNWFPGDFGKGWVYPDGRVVVWRTDAYGDPEHGSVDDAGTPVTGSDWGSQTERVAELASQGARAVTIDPDGQVHDAYAQDARDAPEPDVMRALRAVLGSEVHARGGRERSPGRAGPPGLPDEAAAAAFDEGLYDAAGPESEDVLGAYNSDSTWLNHGIVAGNADALRDAAVMDRIFEAAPRTTAPVTLWRGYSRRDLPGPKEGETLDVPVFMSTADDVGGAILFGDRLMEVRVPAGTPVVPTGAMLRARAAAGEDNGDWGDLEREVLLPRGLKLRLVSVGKGSEGQDVVAEVVSEGSREASPGRVPLAFAPATHAGASPGRALMDAERARLRARPESAEDRLFVRNNAEALPDDQRAALTAYTSDGGNQALDGAGRASLDALVRSHPLPEPVTVSRRIRAGELDGLAPGDVLGEDRFASTTIGTAWTIGAADDNGGLQVELPAGTPAYYVPESFGVESEVILPPNLPLRVAEVGTRRGLPWARAEADPSATPNRELSPQYVAREREQRRQHMARRAASPGRAGADHRWWTPGKHGRGVTLRDGRVWTWNEGEGNHSEVIHANGLTFRDTTAEFYIRPDGGVTAIDKEPARETVRREAPELYLLDDRYRSPGRADPLDGWTDPGTGATLSRRQTSPWLRNYDVALGGERVGQVRFVTRPPRGRRRDGIADDEVSLAWIKLDGPARGKGLSDRIIGRAAKGFAAEGYRRLTATPTNPHAVAMNERLGFRGEGEWQRWTLDLNPPERSPGRALERAERDLWRARHGRGDPAEAQAAVDAARARTPEMSPGRAAGVPEQVDRAFLASVEGEHRLRDGRVLRTRIEEDGVYRDNGRLTVEGYIEDPSVSPELAGPHAMPGGVGVFRRSLRPDPRFGYVVSKEMLWLDPAYRRQGFAADLDRTSEEAWGRIGVRRVELTTDDDGGYVWARLGYRLDPERYMAEGGESADLLLYNTPGFEDLAPTHANIARAYLYQVLDNAVHDTERDAEQEGEREQRPSPAPERLAEVLAMVQRGELRDVGDVAALPDGRALLSDAIWEGYKDIAPDVEASPGRATRARAWVEHGHTLAELRDPETPAENWLGEGQRMSGVRRRGFERTPLGLLVSTGQPDMERYASPALGRLLVPGSYGQSAEDAAEGVPFAADNGGFWGVPEADYKRMAEELSGGRKKPLWVTVPDVFLHPFLTHSGRRIWAPNRKDAEREAGGRVKEDKKTPPHGDADATIARFEQWSQYLRHEGLPAAFVAQDGMDSPERLAWLDKHWDDISAVFIGGSDDFKLGPGAARVAELAREHGKLVHVGRVNTHMRIAYARDVLHADSIDGGTFSKFKDTYLPSGLAYIPTGGPPPTKIGQEWVRSAAEAARGEHAWPRPPGRDKPQWPRGYFPLAEAARAGAVSYQDLADALYAAGLSDYLHLDFEPGTPGFTVRGTPEQQGWVAAYLGTDAPSGESWPQLVLPGGDGEGELAEAAYDRLKHPKDRIGRWVDAPGTRPWQLNGPWRGAPAAPSTFASDRMARSAFRADRPSPEQRAALERYRGDEYQAINDPLRGGREASPGRVRDDVALLDLAVNGSVAAEPVTLYRGLTHSSAIPQSGEFVDRGFVSASLSENTATYFSGASHGDEPAPDQTVAEIRLPAGARALPLSAAVGSAEGEVLLGRGSTFRVVGRRTERWTTRSGSPASVTHVALEYVGTGGSRALSEARRAPQGASLRFFWAPGDVEAGKLEEGRYDEHLHPRDRRGRWAPGRPGKGYLMPDGSIDLWNTDVLGGSPHHMERHPELDENPDAVPLTIDPEGGVMRGDGTHVEPELMRQLRARERSLHAPLRGSPLRFELSPGRATPGRAPDVPGRVVDAARRGGATVHPKTANEPTEGFAVALQGHSSITPADEFFSGPKGAERGRKVLREWLRRERAAFGADTHVGVWLDRKHGEVVLDPVDVFPPDQRDEAIAAGRGRDQQAIYDLGAGAEIPTGGTGGREASGRASRKREQAEAAAEWARLRPGDRFEVKSDGSSGPVSLTGYEVVGNESDQYGPSLRVRDESGQETVFTPDVGSRPRKAGPPDGRPFAEGEVVVRPNGRRASVLSVDGDRVTVLYRSGRSSRQQTFRASQLERAEPRGT